MIGNLFSWNASFCAIMPVVALMNDAAYMGVIQKVLVRVFNVKSLG